MYFVTVYIFLYAHLSQSNICWGKIIEGNVDGILGAFGDFDSDKFTDVFMISSDAKSFRILKANQKEPNLVASDQKCHLTKDHEAIVGLIPGDFHGRAVMEIIVVTTERTKLTKKSSKFSLYLIAGNKSQLNCGSLNHSPFDIVKTHPLSLDANGDMISDLFAEKLDGKRYLWFGSKTGNFTIKEFGTSDNVFKNPSSNAFIDINGDVNPDLFIAGETYMEYYYSSANGLGSDNIKVPYPEGYDVFGESTFVDIDADGDIDHILPACKDTNCESSVFLIWKKVEWVLIAENFIDPQNSSQSLGFVKEYNSDQFVIPLKLRQSDVDGDGYIDLITLMKNYHTKQKKIIILKNVRSSSYRSFVPKIVNANLPSGSDPILATFFDLSEDGKADVLVSTKLKNNRYALTASFNTLMTDACFLKVLVTSGLCYGDCSTLEMDSLDTSVNVISYGTNQPGPFIKYQLIGTDGKKRSGSAGQLSQSSNFALQMPYSIFGLGELPNFVDNLTASIPSGKDTRRSQSWLQIVPDAQVVVIPYPPKDPSRWRTKLFITPSDIILSTLITLTSICCLLVLLIAILHRKEAIEDLHEHEEYKRHWPDSR